MIEIKNLNKYFNKGKKNEIHVINDTSLTLPDNGLVALLGESGCGKTTMLNAIGGLDTVKSGKIFINGKKITSHNVHSVDKIRNISVGYIFQDYKLMDDMTVYDNVALALKMIGIKDKKEIDVRVEYVLQKLGIYRYRKRPASTLSGGERQRVGIARALVKNPDIILADEPTGNLDSKNSVEIMNIIKTISRDRLVILVTHERKLAEFYASRVIELMDGKVVKDYENAHDNGLDYEIDNIFYLKEFKNHDSYTNAEHEVNIYGNEKEKLKINVIVNNGNIYIHSESGHKVEVIDDNSGMEVVDDYKQVLDKEALEDYKFDLDSVGNQNIKKKYSSIYNPVTAIIAGVKKVFSFSVLKKLLLLGFVFAGIFVIYAVGRIGAVMHVVDEDFVSVNQNYVTIEKPSMTVDEFLKLEQRDDVDYILPTSSIVNLIVKFDDYYQTANVDYMVSGSLSSIALIDEQDIIAGRMPASKDEFVMDKMLIDELLKSDNAKTAGVLTPEDAMDRIYRLKNDMGYKLVGIVEQHSPSVYMANSEFYTALYYNNNSDSYDPYSYYGGNFSYNSTSEETNNTELANYALYADKIKLEKGTLPQNDYEIIVNNELKDTYKLNKLINQKVNGQQLKVVGYYTSNENYQFFMSNENTIKYKLINNANKFTLCSKDKSALVESLKGEKYTAYDNYQDSREKFDKGRAETVRNTLILSAVIIGISLIEMFLISRSSFLSRIKEVGTLRAIGAKKTDIYKMFSGEVIAITTLTSLPGMLIAYYGVTTLMKELTALSSYFYYTSFSMLLSIAVIYGFNLVVGLLPVFNTIRKRPAAILARYDVD